MKIIEVNGQIVSEEELKELKKDKNIKLQQDLKESTSDKTVYRKLEKLHS
jgi:hypothetical protein